MNATNFTITAKKKLALWLITPIIVFALAFLVWQRIQRVNAENAPINLLEGTREVTFSYHALYLKPPDLTNYVKSANPMYVSVAEKKMAGRAKNYLVDDKPSATGEEFPSENYLFDMDAEIYRDIQPEIQSKGWRALGTGSSAAPLPGQRYPQIKNFGADEEVRSYSVFSVDPTKLYLGINVHRRFEQGKCLFYVSAWLKRPVVVVAPAPYTVPEQSNILLKNKPELIIIPKEGAKAAIKEEVLRTVSSLLGKSATQFTGTSEVTNE